MPVINFRSERGEPSRRERQRLETRNRLFEAALEEFRRVGFARGQIDRIVERVGVARGTFYFHFPSKEHVLFELQRRNERSIVERFEAFRERPRSIKALLLQIIDAIAAEVEAVGDPGLAREIMAMYVRQPVVVDVSAMPLIGAVVDIFAAAAERGEVRDDIPPEELAMLFLSSLLGFFIGAVDSAEESRAAFDHIIDIFARGIAA
jgi:AcrR family transcriptional regulator